MTRRTLAAAFVLLLTLVTAPVQGAELSVPRGGELLRRLRDAIVRIVKPTRPSPGPVVTNGDALQPPLPKP